MDKAPHLPSWVAKEILCLPHEQLHNCYFCLVEIRRLIRHLGFVLNRRKEYLIF